MQCYLSCLLLCFEAPILKMKMGSSDFVLVGEYWEVFKAIRQVLFSCQNKFVVAARNYVLGSLECADWTNVDIVIGRNYIWQKDAGLLFLEYFRVCLFSLSLQCADPCGKYVDKLKFNFHFFWLVHLIIIFCSFLRIISNSCKIKFFKKKEDFLQ